MSVESGGMVNHWYIKEGWVAIVEPRSPLPAVEPITNQGKLLLSTFVISWRLLYTLIILRTDERYLPSNHSFLAYLVIYRAAPFLDKQAIVKSITPGSANCWKPATRVSFITFVVDVVSVFFDSQRNTSGKSWRFICVFLYSITRRVPQNRHAKQHYFIELTPFDVNLFQDKLVSFGD